jgi:hypothetical protein
MAPRELVGTYEAELDIGELTALAEKLGELIDKLKVAIPECNCAVNERLNYLEKGSVSWDCPIHGRVRR